MKKPNETVELTPVDDGETHINIYTRGKTRLGRLATNLADVPIVHPVFGSFRTAEGLYYWLKTGKNDDLYRILGGFQAKQKGSNDTIVWNSNFFIEFGSAIVHKVNQSEEIKALLKSFRPDLPFTHYYFYGSPSNAVVRNTKGHEWQVALWEDIRKTLIAEGDILELITDESLRG